MFLGGFFVLLQKMRWTMGLVSVSHENRHHRIVWMKHKGIICGMLSAICYGTNPFGALPLYEEGVNTASVLFYRFSMAVVILFVITPFKDSLPLDVIFVVAWSTVFTVIFPSSLIFTFLGVI